MLVIALGVAFARRRAVRRLVRARRLLRRHDPERVRAEPAAATGIAAACATPSPCCSSSRSACCSIRRSCVEAPAALLATMLIIVVGKSIAAFASWSAVRPSDADGADDLGEPRADRRVLLHPRRARRVAWRFCRRRGRDLILAGAIISILLNPLLFALLDRHAGASTTASAQRQGRKPRKPDGHARADPADHAHRSCRADRPWPRRQLHRRAADARRDAAARHRERSSDWIAA